MLAAYARDLAAVQAQYERHKLKPPLPRNAPHVAGHILWARQLLRRIEVPMQRSALPLHSHFKQLRSPSSQSMHHGAAADSTNMVTEGMEGVLTHFASDTRLHARSIATCLCATTGRYHTGQCLHAGA